MWLIQYEDFYFTVGFCVVYLVIKVHSMLYCMCLKIREIIACTTLGEVNLKDILVMKKVSSDHFIHQINRLYKSSHFIAVPSSPGQYRCLFHRTLFPSQALQLPVIRHQREAGQGQIHCCFAELEALGPFVSESAIVFARSSHNGQAT